MKQIEQRRLRAELRSESSGGKTYISGYTARFNVLSANLGGFRERINPSAFDRTLAAGADVTATFNHDPNLLLGRLKSKTLTLSTDQLGLFFRVRVAEDTRAGTDVLAYLRRGDVAECSFGFSCPVNGDKWSFESDPETGNRVHVRELCDVDLIEVGPVVNPAYPSTSAAIDAAAVARQLWPNGVPVEIRSRGYAAPIDDGELRMRRVLASLIDGLL